MKAISYNNIGFTEHRFSDAELKPLRTEISKILKNFENHKAQSANHQLVGNIEREYNLENCKDYMQQLLMPHVGYYVNQFNYLPYYNYNLYDSNIVLHRVWANFQKKHEFNPPHNHAGILSFVLWLKVPYKIEDELKVNPGIKSGTKPTDCKAGQFEFFYTNTMGGMAGHAIPADRSYENTMVMFPAKTFHTVYPFYSSDDYRISVSGNFLFDN